MAFGVKYRCDFDDINEQTSYRIDILKEAYASSVIEVKGGNEPLEIQWAGENSDKFGIEGDSGLIKSSTAYIYLNSPSNLFFSEFFSGDEFEYKVLIYKDTTGAQSFSNKLWWTGYVTADNWVEPYDIDKNYMVTIKAKDGLEKMRHIDFENGGAKITGRQSVLETILFCLNLQDIQDESGTKIGLYECVDIYEQQMNSDTNASPLAQAFIDPEVYRTQLDEPYNCYDVVKNLLLEFNATLRQSQGKWWVVRRNQENGSYTRRLFAASYTDDSASTPTVDTYNPVVTRDENLRIKTKIEIEKAFKAIKVNFIAGQRTNFITDGEFEAAAWTDATTLTNWTKANGGMSISRIDVNENSSEYAVRLNDHADVSGDYIQSQTIKLAEGDGSNSNDYSIRLKYRVNISDVIAQPTRPTFEWRLEYDPDDASVNQYLTDSFVITISSVNTSNDTITVSSNPTATGDGLGFFNNQAISFTTTGTLPAPLAINTVYYVTGLSGLTFSVEATIGGGAIDITDGGTGSHTVVSGLDYVWTTADTKNSATVLVFNVFGDFNIPTFNLPIPNVAADVNLRLYECIDGDYTVINGIDYDSVVGNVGPQGTLPVETTKITGTIPGNFTYIPDEIELLHGDVGGFAAQDFTLAKKSQLILNIRSTPGIPILVAGDGFGFDLNSVGQTYTIAFPPTLDNEWSNTTSLASEVDKDDGNAYVITNNVTTVTIEALTYNSSLDFGTVVVNNAGGSTLDYTQTDAVLPVSTSTVLAKGAFTVQGNVTGNWFEKDDTETDPTLDPAGTPIGHTEMVIEGIMRQYQSPSQRHKGRIIDVKATLEFDSVVHDATFNNGVYFAFLGGTFKAKAGEWSGEWIEIKSGDVTVTNTTTTLNSEVNVTIINQDFSSSTVNQTILTAVAGGDANEIQKNDGNDAFAGAKVFSSTDGDMDLGDASLAGTDRTIEAKGSVANIGIILKHKGTGYVNILSNGGTSSLIVGDNTGNTSFQLLGKSSGSLISSSIVNGSNTTNSSTVYVAAVGGSSAGDAYVRLNVTSVISYAIGIDNSDSDKIKITTTTSGATPSSGTTLLELTSAGDFRFAGGLDSGNNGVFIKRKVLQIGDWNMDTTSSVPVAHGLTAANIRGVQVMIIRDDSAEQYPLEEIQQGNYWTVTSTNIVCLRAAAGVFDSAAFDSTSFNRGWIIIDYV